MKVGFVGLGQLGSAIAKRMIGQGVALTVWNRTKAKAEMISAPVAHSPADLLSGTDVVFLCLFDSRAVAEVLNGSEGLLAGDCRGKVIVDLTTNHFEPVLSFHEQVAVRGASYLESPVLGSLVPASKGELTVLVSGEKPAFERVHPLIEKFGRRIFFLEKPGLAARLKLVNNLVLGTFMAVLAEAVAIGEKAGAERSVVLDILSSGAGFSGVLSAKREKLLTEDYTPHFSAALIHKDLGYLQELAEAVHSRSRLAPVVRDMFGDAYDSKLEHKDLSVVYSLIKQTQTK
jgi:3-hydroxyisobutyrate dehydrogenase